MSLENKHFVCGVNQSLRGQAWFWRGGNAEMRENDTAGQFEDLVSGLLLSRGADREELDKERNPTLRGFLPDPSIFRDMEKAAKRIAGAIRNKEQITVYGDYDVDGATSAALLIRLVRELDGKADHYIPDRLLEGYGPSGEALVKLGEAGSDLVVTVDCGAMAFDALKAAKEADVEVIVVDHHKCSQELPVAVALVNPNRLDETDEAASYGHLAAVGVAFLLAIEILRQLRAEGFFEERKEPDLRGLLDLVALGTVADVAAIHGLNRAFVAQGLKVLAKRDNIGLSALFDASRISRAPIASDLGFALGPRINAGGRVGEATLGVGLLTTEDPEEAKAIAAQLSDLNEDRRAIEAAVQEAAEIAAEKQHNRSVLTLAGKGWHPGVIGIVAGRIKEKVGKPSIVVALDGDDAGNGKGSGRSISGVDLGASIIAAREEGLLVAGGGHAMAAGLTIAPDKLSVFSDWIDDRLAAQVTKACENQVMKIDLGLAPGGLTPDLVRVMDQAGPFGVGWPAPRVTVGPVKLAKCDVVGKDHVRVIAAGRDGRSFKAIAFRAAESAMGQALLHGRKGREFWLAGRAKIDDWGPRPQAELHIEDAAFAD